MPLYSEVELQYRVDQFVVFPRCILSVHLDSRIELFYTVSVTLKTPWFLDTYVVP